MASKLVTQYILPMFESQGKKDLKTKYNKLQGIASSKRKSVKMTGLDEDNTKTVYGELKLSEKLNVELSEAKSYISSL